MSPIKGLTERRRLPRIGKIHLGVRVKQEGKAEYPKATDYLVFDPTHPQYDELVAAYGEKPTELKVIFPLDDPEKFASQYYRLYSRSRGLVCKGDGETAMRMIDTATGALANRDSKEVVNREVVCPGRECLEYGRRGCGEVMNLQFLLPEVSGFGVWQIDTGSINSILNVNNALDLVKQIYGRVSMVPLVLALEPKEVTNPDDGKKKTVRVLNIRSQDNMLEAFRKGQLPPMELVEGMAGYTDAELPEADTAPFIDLPTVNEAEDELWPEDNPTTTTAVAKASTGPATAESKAATQDAPPTGPTTTVLPDLRTPFPPDAKGGDIVVIKDTGTRYEYHVGEGDKAAPGGWVEAPGATVPSNMGEFFAYLQNKGKSYGPTWFYKHFSDYNATNMKEAATVGKAYAEVKTMMGW